MFHRCTTCLPSERPISELHGLFHWCTTLFTSARPVSQVINLFYRCNTDFMGAQLFHSYATSFTHAWPVHICTTRFTRYGVLSVSHMHDSFHRCTTHLTYAQPVSHHYHPLHRCMACFTGSRPVSNVHGQFRRCKGCSKMHHLFIDRGTSTYFVRASYSDRSPFMMNTV